VTLIGRSTLAEMPLTGLSFLSFGGTSAVFPHWEWSGYVLMAQRLWYVRNCSLFQRLSAEQLGSLERRARIRDFPRNSAIYGSFHKFCNS